MSAHARLPSAMNEAVAHRSRDVSLKKTGITDTGQIVTRCAERYRINCTAQAAPNAERARCSR
jgi:hypothetical protein